LLVAIALNITPGRLLEVAYYRDTAGEGLEVTE
jgi:hypothetical protein